MSKIAGRAGWTCVDILRKELEDGLALTAIALGAGCDTAAREQHRENAESAYTAALRLVATVSVSEAEMREIRSDIVRLRDALARIPW
jgi:hypothetical protein